MSLFLIHAYVIDDIEKMLDAYWWGNNRTQSKDITWMSWKSLSVCENDGVSKNHYAFNYAML